MSRILVSYRVKPDLVEENERLVKAVYAELHETKPEGLRYSTFKGNDGVTFYHLASIDTADGSNPLAATAAFKAFQAGIKERCDSPPAPVPLETIGNYGFFE